MGHPRKLRKKYSTPAHPWERKRMEKETVIKDFYGLKNKKEIWKANSKLKNLTKQAKTVIREKTEQSKKEEKQLMEKLDKLNLMDKGSKTEDVLNLSIENVLDRRLQTQVLKSGLARSMKQARQFILHGHIFVSGKKLTVPSYMVAKADKISFNPRSPINDPEHPERITVKKETMPKKEVKEVGVEPVTE